MGKMMLSMILALGLLIVPIGGCTPSEQVVEHAVGSSASTSGVYAFAVAVAEAVNNSNSGISVTVVETGGTLDNLRNMRDGVFAWSPIIGVTAAAQMQLGTEAFEGEAWPELRALFLREVRAARLLVRADAGVTTWSELAGKKYVGGVPGSQSEMELMLTNEILGTGVDIVPMSLADTTRATQEGRILGWQQSNPLNSFDSTAMEVHLTTPLTVVGYTQEEADKILAEYPYLAFAWTPAGGIKQLPDLPAVLESVASPGAVATTRMSQEEGYKIVKAVVEGWDDICAAYPASAAYHPVKDFMPLLPAEWKLPLHAGVVQYAHEMGWDVPAHLIPPEYQR